MKNKGLYLIIGGLILVIIAGLAGIIFSLVRMFGTGTDDDTAEAWTAAASASDTDHYEAFSIETEDGTVYEYKGGEYADETSNTAAAAGNQIVREGEMTLEEANSLSEEELASYLSQVEVPEWVYELSGLSEEMAEEDPWYYTKIYMSINEDIFIPGFGNPYCDERSDRMDAIEDAESADGAVRCTNQIVYLTRDLAVCRRMDDAAFSFGLYTDDTGSVYLDPTSYLDYHIVAFSFMGDTIGNTTVLYDEADVGDKDSEKNKGENSLVLVGASYDQLVSGVDVVWTGNESENVYVRAIDMESYKILASFVIEIGILDDGSFGITDIHSNTIDDVPDDVVSAAVETTLASFFTSDDSRTNDGGFYFVDHRVTSQVTDEQYSAWLDDYVLETLPRIFNGVVIDIETGYAYHRNHFSTGEVYAITVNTDFGARTVYFRTTGTVTAGVQTVTSLSPFAYDFILPTTQDAYMEQYIAG